LAVMAEICLQRKIQANGEDVERYFAIIVQDLVKTLPSGCHLISRSGNGHHCVAIWLIQDKRLEGAIQSRTGLSFDLAEAISSNLTKLPSIRKIDRNLYILQIHLE
jgi:hypothetical protein